MDVDRGRQAWLRLGVAVGVAAALVVAEFALAWDRLPEPMATHWGASGEPNGSLPRVWALVVSLALVVVLGGGMAWLMARRTPARDGSVLRAPGGESFALAFFLGALGVGMSALTVASNVDASTWYQARTLAPWWILVVAVGALGLGILGYRLGMHWSPPPAQEPGLVPAAPVPRTPGAPLDWSGTARSPGQWIGVLAGCALLVFLPSPWRWIGLLLVVIGLLLTRVRARVGSGGLSVYLGGVVPTRRIALEKIEVAGTEFVDPSRWGGWGYRMVPDGSAVVIRAGEGIVLRLKNGRRFAVTVDDAATGAGTINGLLDR